MREFLEAARWSALSVLVVVCVLEGFLWALEALGWWTW